jgi:hypothetical protein
MIYIFSGNDNKSKNSEIKKLFGNKEFFSIKKEESVKEKIFEYSNTKSLFGDSPVVVVENFFDEKYSFSKKEILDLQKSETVFIFIENSFSSANIKKYEEFAKIFFFEERKEKKIETNISFEIANAFGVKDKMKTWVLFNQAIEKGVEPEKISGILFWKIRSISEARQNIFSREEIKRNSSLLVSLYHDAHLGKKDFVIGLEQYLLFVLSK